MLPFLFSRSRDRLRLSYGTIAGMDEAPPATPRTETGEAEQLYCYGHPKTATRLRCSRCDRPICGKCAIAASVGQHCPECVADARRSAPRVKSVARATAPAVLTIMGICIVAYIFQKVSPDVTTRFAAIPGFVAYGEWWRLFTAMFLHSPDSILHILFNMYILYIYGPHIEQTFGVVRFVVIYLVAGFCGSAASYTLGEDVIRGSVGASGAIFGVIGFLVVYFYKRRSGTMAEQYLRNLLFFVAINAVLGFVIPSIDYRAHLGGFVGGMALGYGFDRTGRSALRLQIATAVLVFGVAVSMVLVRTPDIKDTVRSIPGAEQLFESSLP